MTTTWYAPHLDEPEATIAQRDVRYPCAADDAFYAPNLEGSDNGDGTHSILLDLDCEHEYRPSTTPGHGHLIIKARLPWQDADGLGYHELLRVLAKAGVIEEAWLQHAERRQQAFVRAAGVRKPEGATSSGAAL